MNSPLPQPGADAAISPLELRTLLGKVILLDVRRRPAFDKAPQTIPGAEWRDPEKVADWASTVPPSKLVIVYCVHGHEVSRFVAGSLRARGYESRFLAGGIEAWKKEMGELS